MNIKDLDLEKFELAPRLVVVEAGAGSGKTYNLVRIVKKMSEQGKDISRVLLVTFTNAAALEMRQRMRELLEKEGSSIAQQQLASMQITTIHSFCHRAYAEYGPTVGFPSIEGIPQDSSRLACEIGEDFWRKKTRDQAALDVSPKEIVKATELLLGENETEGKGIRLSGKLQASGLRAFVQKRVAELQATGGLLTFDTVIQNFLDALRDPVRGPELRKSIRDDFDACLVDESQDTDAKQWEVFERIFTQQPCDANAKLLVMVGDRKQSIYGFRGANVDNYKEVVAKAKDRLGLNENNRSSSDLIEFFNAIFKNHGDKGSFFGTNETFQEISIPNREKDDPRPKIKADLLNCPGNPITVLDCKSTSDIVHEVARMMLELRASGKCVEATRDKEIAFQTSIGIETTIGVLTRTGAFARKVHLALVNQGIPAALATQSSVFTSTLSPSIHLLLQAVLKPEDAGIRRTLFLMQPRLFGQTGDLQAFIEANDEELAAWLRDIRTLWMEDGFGMAWEALLNTFPRLNVGVISSIRAEFAKGPMGQRQLADLAHIGEILSVCARRDKLTPEALLHFLAQRITNATEFDDEAKDLEQIRPESANPQVVVRTIHSAKGLEFHGVILPEFGKVDRIKKERGGLLRDGRQITLVSNSSDDGELQKYADQSNQDDANLLYVALTRAQRKICVMWDDAPKKEGIPSGFPIVMKNAKLGESAASFVKWLGDTFPERGYTLESPADETVLAQLKESGLLRKPIYIKALATKPRFIPFERGSTSFTELSKGPKGLDDEDAPKHGHGTNPLKSTTKPTKTDLTTLPFLAFKGGKGPGVVMHSILEKVDFIDGSKASPSQETADLVERLLRESGICLQKDAQATARSVEETKQLYLQMLPKWLKHPLSGKGAIQLGKLGRTDRSSEIRFSLRCDINSKKIGALAGILKADADPSSILGKTLIEPSEDNVRGLLTGSIDLAFRHDGHFYIVDWKSNILGPKPQDYRAEVMDAEILANKYHLQYTLYAAVFHLHMRTLMPEWNYDKHFGGCHYLFMRAFGHGDTGLGDHFHRPSLKTIEDLLAVLSPIQA